jgi:glycosyltransferase involved in cell wall biosynthesis
MKVLNVNILLDSAIGGGTAERTFQMSRALTKAGVECTILTTSLGLTPDRIAELSGVNVIVLPTLIKRFYIPRFSYRMIRDIVKNADIIHLMNHWSVLNALIYLIARNLKKPYVVCPAGALQIYGRSRLFKKFYSLVIGKRIIRNANGCVAIGANEIDQFQVYGVAACKTVLIHNGINAEDYQMTENAGFREKYGLGNNPFILFMGRLSSIKGPDLLLHAFCNIKDKLQDFHLVFAGPNGGMLTELKKIIKTFGVNDRVHFVGYLSGVTKSQAYHAADLLVIPSRQEAMSIVVLEAGITGTPVLITDRCGFNEVADIGGGQVVSASLDGLQEGLIEMLKDSAQLKSMGANLKRYTCEHLTWDSIINKYLKLYRRILEAKSL